MSRVCLMMSMIVAIVAMGCGGSSQSPDSGLTGQQCLPNAACLACIEQNCNNEATTAFGGGYVNSQFNGGRCPNLMACGCANNGNGNGSGNGNGGGGMDVCVQQSGSSCVAAFTAVTSCLDAVPCGIVCTGSNNGGNGSGGAPGVTGTVSNNPSMGGAGGNVVISHGGTGGATGQQCLPTTACLTFIEQNCNNAAVVAFGPGYVNSQFSGGVCPNLVACSCTTNGNGNGGMDACAQQSGAACEAAFTTLTNCIDATPYGTVCTGSNSGGSGGSNVLTVSGSTMNFGNTELGLTPSQALGSQLCVAVTGPNASTVVPQVLNDTSCATGLNLSTSCAFSVQPLYCLTPDSCNVCVTFAPNTGGMAIATLSITSILPGVLPLTVVLTGVGDSAGTGTGTGGTSGTGGRVVDSGVGGAGGSVVIGTGGVVGIVGTGGSVVIGTGGTGGIGGTGGTGGQVTGSGVVAFTNGKASGAMTGWGWVSLGPNDVVIDPTCNGAPVTSGLVCVPTWNWNSATALCMSGIIPALPATPAKSDYDANWGAEIGVSSVLQNDPVTNLPVSGIGTVYSSVALAVSGAPLTGLRVSLHRHGDPSSVTYCSVYRSGQIPLTSFNTACWDNSGLFLTVADAPLIDLVMLMVPSTQQAIAVTNLCITGIIFGGIVGVDAGIGTGGTTGSTTGQPCSPSVTCLSCVKQNCDNEAVVVFGSGYMNVQYGGGLCPNRLACSCKENTDPICTQPGSSSCVAAGAVLDNCITASPCNALCKG